MLDSRGFSAAAAPVAELERKVQWRAISMLIFLGMMVALAGIAAFSIVAPPDPITGLPDDPEVRAAAAAVRGRVRVDAGELRFYSALLGGEGEGRRFGARDRAAVADAEARLHRALERDRSDPRPLAALAVIDLIRRSPSAAERRYVAALGQGARYGEARLGLGVALALRAELESDPLEQRRLLLRSLAQLSTVESRDPAYTVALYDRALLLERVGRTGEARRVVEEYLARDPDGPWAERLRAAPMK